MLNYTFNTTTMNSLEVCKLNQAELIAQTEKISPLGYYLLVIGLACLVFYFIIQPRLSKSIQESLWSSIGYLGMCFVFMSAWVLFFFVFQISEESLTFLSRLGAWLMIPLLLLIGWFVYKWIKKEG